MSEYLLLTFSDDVFGNLILGIIFCNKLTPSSKYSFAISSDNPCEELKATPTVITKTGLFDNIDKLYGSATGGTTTAAAATAAGEVTAPPPGGGFETAPPPEEVPAAPEAAPPAGGEAELTPENRMASLNILVENNLIDGSKFIDLGMAQESLGEISKELDELLKS